MMQRKITIVFLVLFMFLMVPCTFAQKGRSEVSFSYGTLSIYSLVNKPPYNASSGVGLLSYKYYLNNKTTLGLGLGYENVSNWGSFFTVAPEFSYAYMDLRDSRIRVKIYGSGSLGLTVFKDYYQSAGTFTPVADESGARLTAHASPFGIRVGRKLAAFMEIGIGYKGTFNFGLAYRFKTERKINYNEN